jgi:hypothetical protein
MVIRCKQVQFESRDGAVEAVKAQELLHLWGRSVSFMRWAQHGTAGALA